MSEPLLDADLLVVGLGPGGGSAAAVAAEAGMSVIAVERHPVIGEPVQCAEFIPNPMGRYAMPDGVLIQRISGMKSYLPSGAHKDSPFTGIMVDRAAFDRAIAQRAAQAGARILAGTVLETVDEPAGEARVRDAQGAHRRIRYRALVAGDGPQSPVAKQLGLAALEVVHTRQYTVPLRRAYEDTDVWLSDEYPGGYAWLFPRGKVANLGMGADRRLTTDFKGALDSLHAQLASEGLVGEAILGRTGGPIPVQGIRDPLVHGKVLFVGDAAGLTHPITGAGISAAVISGERAGAAVSAWLAGEGEALEDFEEDIRDHYEASLARAVQQRRRLARIWQTPQAREDASLRPGWIAFDEYFRDVPMGDESTEGLVPGTEHRAAG